MRFTADGIVGGRRYSLKFRDRAVVIVGPNGTGKSTFLLLYYLFISQQWSRLAEVEFQSLELEIGDLKLRLQSTDLYGLGGAVRLPPRMQRQLDTLRDRGQLSMLFEPQRVSAQRVGEISSYLDISRAELEALRHMVRNESAHLLNKSLVAIQEKMRDVKLGKILYMPTYRRIEKDLKSILPDIDERYRARITSEPVGRRGANFHEIVNFGMEDVNSVIDGYINNINRDVKNKSINVTQEFIRDMVRGEIENYSVADLRQVPSERIARFIARLDNTLFSDTDKGKLETDLNAVRRRTHGKPKHDQRYLGYFVEKMLAVFDEIEERERKIRSFADVVDSYLHKSKIAIYDSAGFRVVDSRNGNPIKLSDLSSGEKQVIAIFAYLYLSDNHEYRVLIDEPELSLSVPWQKTFLPDILRTGRCQQLVAVTHSPFVISNELRANLVDVQQLEETDD